MIEVENVSKSFRLSRKQKKKTGAEAASLLAVNNVSCVCKPGRITVLLGPNGAGKTTLLRMLATLLKATEGRIRIDGQDTLDASNDARRAIGFQTGSTGLYDRLTARETIRYFGRLNGIEGEPLEERCEALLDQLDIRTFADRRVGKLSTGMKQRVAIARTIIHNPPVLVFDEATSGLDILASRAIIALVRQCRDEGKTVIFSTHRMDEASVLADDLLIMNKGSLVFDGEFSAFSANRDGRSLENAFVSVLEGSAE